MRESSAFQSVIAALAAAAALSFIATPTASADATSDLLKACKITDNEQVQELAIDLTLDEGALLDMINNFRTENGVAPLEFDRDVTRAAVIESHDNVLRGRPDHQDVLGRKVRERLQDCGVDAPSGSENIYAGYGLEVSQSAANAFEYWKKSDQGHRENMLDPAWTKVGIALGYNGEIGQVKEWNRVHWTAVFTS